MQNIDNCQGGSGRDGGRGLEFTWGKDEIKSERDGGDGEGLDEEDNLDYDGKHYSNYNYDDIVGGSGQKDYFSNYPVFAESDMFKPIQDNYFTLSNQQENQENNLIQEAEAQAESDLDLPQGERRKLCNLLAEAQKIQLQTANSIAKLSEKYDALLRDYTPLAPESLNSNLSTLTIQEMRTIAQRHSTLQDKLSTLVDKLKPAMDTLLATPHHFSFFDNKLIREIDMHKAMIEIASSLTSHNA